MADTTLWAELLAFGTGLALSPIHLGVLLLLLLGPKPIQRGSWFVTGWIVTTLVTVILLLTVGHSLVLDMTQGSHHRTALDLLGGGALISLGLKELLRSFAAGEEQPAWTHTIERFINLPLPLLIAVGALTELISPDDLFLFAKTSAVVLAASLPSWQEIVGLVFFTFGSSLLLLIPLVAVIIGRERVIPLLQSGKQLLFAKGDLIVGGVSFALGAYLGWQGISGLPIVI